MTGGQDPQRLMWGGQELGERFTISSPSFTGLLPVPHSRLSGSRGVRMFRPKESGHHHDLRGGVALQPVRLLSEQAGPQHKRELSPPEELDLGFVRSRETKGWCGFLRLISLGLCRPPGPREGRREVITITGLCREKGRWGRSREGCL